MIGIGLFAVVAWVIPSYFRIERPLLPPEMFIGAVIAIGIALLPPSASRVDAAMAWINSLSATGRRNASILVGAGSSATIALVSKLLDRPMQLLWHDEFQFHLQSQLLARFRLWLPAHPLREFFDTFYVLMQPHYAPQSFPGAALLFVPAIWLHLPTWVLPLLLAGAACGLTWWILSELTDATCASVAVVAMLCNWGFVRVATMYLAQVPVLVLGLTAFAAMLHWQKTHSYPSASIIGVALGWAAITRPLDALCYGVVILIGLISSMRGAPRRRVPRAGLVIVAAAAPFLVLQAVFNRAITGSFDKTPFALYNERDQPALVFDGVGDAERPPLTTVPQKQAFYAFSTLGFVKMFSDPRMRPSILWRIRLNESQSILAPGLVLLPFAALGVGALFTRQRWLLAGLIPLFLVSYQRYPIYHSHYITFVLPALMLLFALAPEAAQEWSSRWGVSAKRLVATLIVCLSVGAMLDRSNTEPVDEMLTERRRVEQQLARVHAPAIVLFTAPARPEEMHTEFVYNDDVAWPDDAPIIRAHDRGVKNTELFAYYAQKLPTRAVWKYDRTTHSLDSLGTATALTTTR